MSLPKLLIVEDDEAARLQLKYALASEFTLAFAGDRGEGLTSAASFKPDLVLLDLGLPPSPDAAVEGLKALDQLLGADRRLKVVVLTGNTDRDNALAAVELGAFDYHSKPVDITSLTVVLKRAAYLRELEEASEAWVKDREGDLKFEDLLGNTPVMRQIFAIIQRVGQTDATVLIEGESGTGKELIARAIHRRSARRQGPLIPINCGAIPETLLESELFGHEKGAFTGAHTQRKGKLELADKGTLFLDEIGELSLLLQVKLLRFLQERSIERVGGRDPIKLDLRIVAATNSDLQAQIQRGLFREDLYYRLSVVSIKVPPLRERGADIVLLANALLRRAQQEHRRRIRFSANALQAMVKYAWPGNIREMESKISRAVIMTQGRLIEPADLDLAEPPSSPTESLRDARAQAEREAIVAVLTRHRGNISRAAQDLKVSRPTFHSLLEKYDVDAKSFRG
jgi:two-component system NtrC family response regulator